MDKTIRNAEGERLDYSYAAAGRDAPIVLVGHGVTGNKDRPWARALEEWLHGSGLSTLRLSFSGNGDSEGRFEDSCISKEVRDLDHVLSALVGEYGEDRPLAYVGHSMGAAVGVLTAAQDPRIRALVSLAGMVDTAGFVQRKFGELTPGRDLMWDLADCPLSQTYVDDLNEIGTVAHQASRIEVPWLLVHGTADSVVPMQDSLDIQIAAGSARPDLLQIPAADHVFTGAWSGSMAERVARWLASQLKPSGSPG